MLKQFLDFVKYYGKDKKAKIILFVLISILAGGLEFVGIGLIYPFLMFIVKPQNISNTPILFIGFLIVLMFLCKNILMILCTYVQNKFVINWKNDINKMLMKFYLNVPYKKTLETISSEKIYNLTVLTSQTLETFVLRTLVFCTNCVIIFLILALMLIKFPLISLFTVIFVALSMLTLNKFFKNKTQILAPKMLEFSLKNNNQVIENVKNLKEIRIFNAEKYFLEKFNNVQKENNNVIFKNSFYASIPPYVIEMILVLALILIAGVITWQNSGETSKIIASYGLILAVVFRIAPSLNRIQVALNHMNSSKEMIAKMNEEYVKNEFDKVSEKTENISILEFSDNLKFENVSFSYKNQKEVIKDVSLEIKKGEFVGIIGLSGAGKTTLADILMGLLPVDGGRITLDGQEISENNIDGLRKLIGYVPQEMNILDDSYKNNVAWGMDFEKIDERRVEKCLKMAKLFDFVEENGGINQKIKGLSQGQKQRLLIARALYKNPEIIIFDEATSSLDVETENEITQMLTSLKQEKTIIAIAHRLTTLKECDELIYLKDGSVVDCGTFEELKNKYEDFENLINLSKL